MSPELRARLAFRAAQKTSKVYNDALFNGENNDCSVIALQNLTGITYVAAHDLLKSIGRQTGAVLNINCSNRI